jgi:tricorn protease
VASAGYLRFPHLHDDLLAFVAEEDVWLAPVAGGRAWRLSADHSDASYPRFSRDGALIAWTSRHAGHREIYVAAADGGARRRITYWGDPMTRLCGWTPQGEALVLTAAGQPFSHQTWAHAVPAGIDDAALSGTRLLPFGPVGDVAMEAGAVALLNGTIGRDPASWKRYRGGTSGRLWVSAAPGGAGSAPDGAGGEMGGGGAPGGAGRPAQRFSRVLAGLAGQFFSPMLVGGRLAFLSDHEGTGNIYSCALDGTDLRRHTDHDGCYARNASTDGSRVVYHCAGDIWLLEDLRAGSEPRRVEINLGSPAAAREPVLVSGDDHLDDLSCDATGQASAVEVRGTVHWLTHRDGPARVLSAQAGVRARLPRVLAKTGQVVWVTDAEGADALEIAQGDDSGPALPAPPRRLAAGAIGRVTDLAAAPDGSAVAVAAHDGRLHIVDVASGEVSELAVSDNGEVTGLAWSPDSAWLAWSHPGPTPLRRLRLARLADRTIVDVTDGRFTDTDPAFTLDGLHLAFLSLRSFDPVYDAHVLDLSFPYGSRPYLVPLAAATPSPFGPLPGGRPADDAKDDAGRASGSSAGSQVADGAGSGGAGPSDTGARDSGARDSGASDSGASDSEAGDSAADGHAAGSGDVGKKDSETVTVVVDAEGLAGRVVQVPVPESRYASLRAVRDGLAWLREPVTGNLGEGGANLNDATPRPALERFDLRARKCTELEDEVDWFEVSGDGTRILLSDHGQLSVVPSGRKADPDSPDDRVSVEKSRARFIADPVAQWRNGYAEAERIIRHDFWVADLAGVDWDAALDAYRPLLDRIAGPSDFADLLWEALGELGTSHAYVRAASAGAGDNCDAVGLLGADLEPGPDGAWKVSRVVPGESSDPRARSPLSAPGAGIQAGDAILAVDGQRVDPAAGPRPLLVGSAGKPVELTIGPAAGGPPRRAVVVALTDERRLRYQDWVAGRRRLVRELGNDRIGYLHVPDMVSGGWADFHRDLRGEMVREALIVDVRSNSGGHTSQLVVEKLARRVIGWDVPRGRHPSTYPQDAPRGPVVAVADECAGSDGDIVTAAIRTLGLGPVVGTRTWGGVVGIDSTHELVDGTGITVPRYAFWFSRFGWDVENYGVDPDVEIVMSPEDWATGNDIQLRTAIRLAQEALDERPAVAAPPTSDRPSKRRPELPPRPAG